MRIPTINVHRLVDKPQNEEAREIATTASYLGRISVTAADLPLLETLQAHTNAFSIVGVKSAFRHLSRDHSSRTAVDILTCTGGKPGNDALRRMGKTMLSLRRIALRILAVTREKSSCYISEENSVFGSCSLDMLLENIIDAYRKKDSIATSRHARDQVRELLQRLRDDGVCTTTGALRPSMLPLPEEGLATSDDTVIVHPAIETIDVMTVLAAHSAQLKVNSLLRKELAIV